MASSSEKSKRAVFFAIQIKGNYDPSRPEKTELRVMSNWKPGK